MNLKEYIKKLNLFSKLADRNDPKIKNFLIELQPDTYNKYNFDFNNELLNDIFDYKFKSGFHQFLLYYPHFEYSDFIVFGDFDDGNLVGIYKLTNEVVIIYDENMELVKFCSESVDAFFNLLISLYHIEIKYEIENQLITSAEIETLIDLAGGWKYADFVNQISLQYSEIW